MRRLPEWIAMLGIAYPDWEEFSCDALNASTEVCLMPVPERSLLTSVVLPVYPSPHHENARIEVAAYTTVL